MAVSIGTSHGAYKFNRKPDGAILAKNVVKDINKRLPSLHMVIYGSSSVSLVLQDIINANGGEMTQTWGAPFDEIVEGIKHGVRKVNIDTDCRMAISGQVQKILLEKKAEFDPRNFTKTDTEAMQGVCESHYETFGTAGNASKYKTSSADSSGRAL